MPWWKLASSWSSLVWSLARRSNIKTGIDLTMERRYHKKQMPRDVVVPETHPKKESGVVNILEKMVKTKARKIAGGLLCTRNLSWLHGKYNETINHFLAGCTVLAPNEYLARHNRPLMILAVEWAKPKELIIYESIWYKKKWNQRHAQKWKDKIYIVGVFPSTLSYHRFCVPNGVGKRPKAFSYAEDIKKSAGVLQSPVSPQ